MKAQSSFSRIPELRSKPERVDREANIIHGCKVIQMGEVNDDRPFIITQATLAQVVQFGNENPKGLKARFTHPNLCEDGLGRHLGRWKNFRQESDAVYADLHVAETAFDTPHGNLGAYVLDMAEDDPESFGVSIAAKLSSETLKALEEHSGEGKTVPYLMQALRAADIVGDPAATRGGLFSIETVSDRRDVPHFVSQFLTTYFADADPQAVASQALRFISNHYGVNLTMGESRTTEDLATQLQPYVEAFGDQGYIYHGKGMTLADCYKAELASKEAVIVNLNETLGERDATIADLKSRLESALANAGEGEDLGHGERTELTDAQKTRAAKVEDLKSQGVTDATARFAASLTK